MLPDSYPTDYSPAAAAQLVGRHATVITAALRSQRFPGVRRVTSGRCFTWAISHEGLDALIRHFDRA